MKITVLAENTSCREGIGCEHGLSLFIETNRCRILFDMGQSTLFAENALRLGVDLSKVELVVLLTPYRLDKAYIEKLRGLLPANAKILFVGESAVLEGVKYKEYPDDEFIDLRIPTQEAFRRFAVTTRAFAPRACWKTAISLPRATVLT